MSFIIFIIVLAILVFVHELGHFLTAKKFEIKVTEFGIGFPPRLWTKQKGETLYSVNAVPFGGYVKIFGEDPDDLSLNGPESARSITSKPRIVQAAVLFGGVFFNFLFAWLLISAGYIIGLPTPADYVGPGMVTNPALVVTSVAPESPAFAGGLKAGDVILEASSEKYVLKELSPQLVSNFIEAHGKEGVVFQLGRGKEIMSSSNVIAQEGIVAGRFAIGISMEIIGTLKLPPHLAVWEGGKTAIGATAATALGLGSFIADAFKGQGDLSQVTGPVGIVGLVGDVTNLGFVYLLSFTAIISINLAIINLLPLPALDGGRLLFLLIEAIMQKSIPPRVTNALNGIGFALLILLMIVVTFNDVMKLF
jgi:regulator of sigma E protease